MVELYEFPVLLEETNESIILLESEENIERAVRDPAFLLSLVKKHKNSLRDSTNTTSVIDCEYDEENCDEPDPTPGTSIQDDNSDNKPAFIWPDNAVLLLLELYREKEHEFTNSCKRSHKIWSEIADQIRDMNPAYAVTAQQCTSKMSGLKRTYKRIIDMNKKSGNHRTSWSLFSTMDSLFGDKASTKPLSIATSDGPSNPGKIEASNLNTDPKVIPKKRKRIENILEEHFQNSEEDKKKRNYEIQEREANRERRHQERLQAAEKRHNEGISMQKSFIDMMTKFLDKV